MSAHTPPVAGDHDYVSTACLHGLGDRCRQTCKFCHSPCLCAHHLTDGECAKPPLSGQAEHGIDTAAVRREYDDERNCSRQIRALCDALDRQREETARLRQFREDYSWAEMLTGQTCARGEHGDWFVDSEHNHLCPFCQRDDARARLAEIRALAAEDRVWQDGDRYEGGWVPNEIPARTIRAILDRPATTEPGATDGS